MANKPKFNLSSNERNANYKNSIILPTKIAKNKK